MKHEIKIGDVRAVLHRERSNRFDACLTDPPYGLGFMGMQWDKGVPGPEVWRDVLRVLKPGALMLAFGGTRTFHRLACAIEDAGFEIRDCLMWLYGSGFPKAKSCLKPAWEPIILARKRGPIRPFNIDALRIGNTGGCVAVQKVPGNRTKNAYGGGLNGVKSLPVDGLGRWPTNLILDQAAATQLGEVSRFFYVAKASPRDRGAANNHPTVKPTKLATELARYLLKLLLPPTQREKRRLLVPFSGSGSELLGARAAGWDYALGIERNSEYAKISTLRLGNVAPA